MKAILIEEKLSFKGDSKKLLKYKKDVENCLDKVGIIESESFGCYELNFEGKIIRLPKSCVNILN